MSILSAVEFNEAVMSLLITNVVVIFGALAKMVYDMWCRIQDRKDRQQLAEFTAAQLEVVLKAGGKREKVLVEEIKKTRSVAIQSIKETREFAKIANNVNEKIASIGAELKDKPQDVHIINGPSDPVMVEEVTQKP